MLQKTTICWNRAKIKSPECGVRQVKLDTGHAAVIFKAFCDENRVKILQMLKSGEKCACKLLEDMNITQPTLSHHMKILCDSGIVEGRKDGKWMYYSISAAGVDAARQYLDGLTAVENAKSACCDECDKP